MSLSDKISAVVAAIGAELKLKADAARTVNGHALTADVTVTKADVGLGSVDNTADASKSVASAAKLTTTRTINGVSFNGTANITVADSTKVPTSRTINGKALSANVTLTQDDVGDGTTAKKYTATEKSKLAGIADGAEVNVQSDWSAASGDAAILNKPTITDGTDGDSAYEIAVANGFVGNQTAWLASLKGADGAPGFTQVTQAQYDALSDTSGIYIVEA